MQLTIMEFFQGMASPALDTIVELMTMLGEETVFIVAVALFLWLSSKKQGFVIFSTLFTSLIGMSVLKAVIRAPRPFQVIEEIKGKRVATATGYSFPSGHTTGAASFYSALALTFRKRQVSILCAVAILLVGFSRMYLGVHWPIDVFGGLALGITVTFVTYGWFSRIFDDTERLIRFSTIAGATSAFFAVLLTILIEAGVADPVGFTDPMKLFSLAAGGYLGFAWDQKHIRYTTGGTRGIKVLRLLLGIFVVLVIQALKVVLPDHMASGLFRYVATGLWITALYPYLGTKIRIGNSRLFPVQ
jgi:undecaprenyl-diphosphatase